MIEPRAPMAASGWKAALGIGSDRALQARCRQPKRGRRADAALTGAPAGSFCYLVELPGPLIDWLVNLGWLAGVARNDKAAVLAAFQRFVQQALGFSRSGSSE